MSEAIRARVLLVRHGQSTWNAEGRWQGRADPPLSVLGEAQATSARAAPVLEEATVVFTSDLQRARRTAELLAGSRVPVVSESRLQERSAGEWEGLTRAEIEAGWPGYLADRRRPGGWEPDEALLARALEALAAIAAPGVVGSDDGTAVAVSHGGLIRVVERALGAAELPVPNLGGRWIEFAGDDLRLGSRALLVDVGEVTVPRQI